MGVRVKIFDEEHEKDLEEAVNRFLTEYDGDYKVRDIKYQLSHFSDGPGQIYSYSAMVIYEEISSS